MGKTESTLRLRLNHHMHRARAGKRHHVYCWIRKLLSKGVLPTIEVVEEKTSHEDLIEAERFYISYFRSLGFKLTNHTDGGEGCIGYKHTAEAKKQMSEHRRGRRSPRFGRHKTALSSDAVLRYSQGVSATALSKEHGVSGSVILKYLRCAGVKTRTATEQRWATARLEARPPLRKLDDNKRLEVARLYTQEHLGSEAIATQMGVSPRTVLNTLRQLGVTRRTPVAGRWLSEKRGA